MLLSMPSRLGAVDGAMNRLRLSSTVVALAAVFTGPLVAQPSDSPGGWTAVSIENLKRQEAWRKTSPTAFAKVHLDMNGDGLQDEAALVVDRVRHRSGLRVCLATKDPGVPADCRILAEHDQEDAYEIMGLDVRAPGCHDYNALNDRTDVDGRICSRRQGLDYFRFASSSSFFLYDQKTDRFNRYWDSD